MSTSAPRTTKFNFTDYVVDQFKSRDEADSSAEKEAAAEPEIKVKEPEIKAKEPEVPSFGKEEAKPESLDNKEVQPKEPKEKKEKKKEPTIDKSAQSKISNLLGPKVKKDRGVPQNVYFTKQNYDLITQACQETGCNLSFVVNKIISQFFES